MDLGRVIIHEFGNVLQDLRIVFDPDLGRGAPQIRRAVEFYLHGIPHYADFDRPQRCTAEAAPQIAPAARGTRNA